MSLVLKNVVKSFDGKKVLDGFSLDIQGNARIAIMGESGRGKTTLLNIIAGLEKPESGTVQIPDGTRITMCFQEDRLIESLTVYRNIKMAAGKNITKKDVAGELEKVGLDSKILNNKVNTLSGGMKRRVALLRALMAESEIVLLDEPTKGLDDANKRVVLDYIKEHSINKILLFVTHDLDEAKYVCDKVVTIV